MIYRLQRPWTVMREVTAINAGTQAAFVVDGSGGFSIADIPVLKLTSETPSGVFTKHICRGSHG